MVNTSALESRGRGFKSRSRQVLEFHLCSFIYFFHWFQFICVMYKDPIGLINRAKRQV